MGAPSQRDRHWALVVVAAVLGSVVVALALDAALRKSTAGKGSAGPSRPTPGAEQRDVTPEQQPGAGDLLPNMRIQPATNVSVDTGGPGRRLRFDSTLFNAGAGPLELVPQGLPRCPRGQRHVAQVVYADGDGDGRFDAAADRGRAALPAGCMLFHPGHDHWHVDASAAYALTPAGSIEPLVARGKVSFCLRDSDRLRAGQGASRAYGECKRNREQGISVGWSDLYDASLPGQTLPLAGSLPDGDYCLRMTADPLDLFRETVETDNASAVLVRLAGNRVVVPEGGRCAV